MQMTGEHTAKADLFPGKESSVLTDYEPEFIPEPLLMLSRRKRYFPCW
jgi:hypothetical protein